MNKLFEKISSRVDICFMAVDASLIRFARVVNKTRKCVLKVSLRIFNVSYGFTLCRARPRPVTFVLGR